MTTDEDILESQGLIEEITKKVKLAKAFSEALVPETSSKKSGVRRSVRDPSNTSSIYKKSFRKKIIQRANPMSEAFKKAQEPISPKKPSNSIPNKVETIGFQEAKPKSLAFYSPDARKNRRSPMGQMGFNLSVSRKPKKATFINHAEAQDILEKASEELEDDSDSLFEQKFTRFSQSGKKISENTGSSGPSREVPPSPALGVDPRSPLRDSIQGSTNIPNPRDSLRVEKEEQFIMVGFSYFRTNTKSFFSKNSLIIS